MPLYEYQCDACEHRFEVIQKFSDAPIDKCPSCGGTVRKLVSSPAIQFKGTGWYITDYAKKSGTGAGTRSGESGSGSGSGSEKGGGDTSGGDKSASEKSSGDKSSGSPSGKSPNGTKAAS